jgi:penicillin amidase
MLGTAAALTKIGVTLCLAATLGCGVWLRSHHPPPADPALSVGVERIPNDRIEILLDQDGVPTVYAEDEAGLVYGLGFMHGRDRAFQIRVLRAAALGRLTELFGERALDADRQLRILTYRLDEAAAAVSDEDRRLIERYLDGLDEGARHAGKTAEQSLLGDAWERLEIRDVVAIARLQSWNLSKDMDAELARSRLVARLPVGDARLKALLIDVPDDGAAIVSRHQDTAPELPDAPPLPSKPTSAVPDSGADRAEAFLASLGLERHGASNAWAVHGSRTESGKPILCNDPHLAHRAPGVFYLARMVTHNGRVDVTGGTFPGLPAVLIGHNQRVAWSMTTSFADTQDLVRVSVDPEDPRRYSVDGESKQMRSRTERFMAGDRELGSEELLGTVFGPILPSVWDSRKEPGNVYALMWSGFDGQASARQFTSFWDLARSRGIGQARAALEGVNATQSTLLATVDGDIGFHLMGTIPVRARAERLDLPRDGRSAAAGWSGNLTAEDKPSATNPELGYLVTANQRIAVDERARSRLGGYGATSHRARRITERLKAVLDSGKANRESLKSIQLDSVSLEARDLAPVFARRCPTSARGHPPGRVRDFCESLKAFDGDFDTDAPSLPFEFLLRALQAEVISLHAGDDIAAQIRGYPFITEAVEDAILMEDKGGRSPLFDDRRTPEHDGLDAFLQRAAARALDEMKDRDRLGRAGWRWGAAHTLSLKSPLAAAPLVGGSFATPPLEIGGNRKAPRADAGTPVTHGAVLRMAVEMTDPPTAGFILDFGQSGHARHADFGGMTERWNRAELIDLGGDYEAVKKRARGKIELRPQVIIEE